MSIATDAIGKMYAVIYYTDYRKNNSIVVKLATPDLDYAKRVALYYTTKDFPNDNEYDYKIAQNYLHREGYVQLKDKVIVDYMIVALNKKIEREEQKKEEDADDGNEEEESYEEEDEDYELEAQIEFSFTGIWAVVQINDDNLDVIGDIDGSLLLSGGSR